MPSHPDRVRRNYDDELWDGRPESLNAALYRDGCGEFVHHGDPGPTDAATLARMNQNIFTPVWLISNEFLCHCGRQYRHGDVLVEQCCLRTMEETPGLEWGRNTTMK